MHTGNSNSSSGSPENPEEEKLSTREGYDKWSSIYDDEDNPLIQLEKPVFQKMTGDVRGLRVLDAGCGTGRHALALAAAGAEVTAMDFSEGMLARARAKRGAADVRWIEHDLATSFPFANAGFDLAISCLVLDHIRDLEGVFRELKRVVKNGGFIVTTVMHPAMMLRGVQARFTDPKTGRRVLPAAVSNQISTYVMSVQQAGLTFDQLSSIPLMKP